MKTPVEPTKDGIKLNLYVQPGAANSAFAGIRQQAIKLRVLAPPIDGQANKEVQSCLARFFGVPRSSVVIQKGDKGRNKTVHIAGETQALLQKAAQLIDDNEKT